MEIGGSSKSLELLTAATCDPFSGFSLFSAFKPEATRQPRRKNAMQLMQIPELRVYCTNTVG